MEHNLPRQTLFDRLKLLQTPPSDRTRLNQHSSSTQKSPRYNCPHPSTHNPSRDKRYLSNSRVERLSKEKYRPSRPSELDSTPNKENQSRNGRLQTSPRMAKQEWEEVYGKTGKHGIKDNDDGCIQEALISHQRLQKDFDTSSPIDVQKVKQYFSVPAETAVSDNNPKYQLFNEREHQDLFIQELERQILGGAPEESQSRELRQDYYSKETQSGVNDVLNFIIQSSKPFRKEQTPYFEPFKNLATVKGSDKKEEEEHHVPKITFHTDPCLKGPSILQAQPTQQEKEPFYSNSITFQIQGEIFNFEIVLGIVEGRVDYQLKSSKTYPGDGKMEKRYDCLDYFTINVYPECILLVNDIHVLPLVYGQVLEEYARKTELRTMIPLACPSQAETTQFFPMEQVSATGEKTKCLTWKERFGIK